MRNLRLAFNLIAISLFAILVLRFVPGTWLNDVKFANSTIGYLVMGLIFYVSVYFIGSQSLEYFRFPRFDFKSGFAMSLAAILVSLEISRSHNVHLDSWVAVRGIGYLLTIGFAEEIFSRGFIFGALHRFGTPKAIVISSLLFGLMHLNLYVGAQWDNVFAYWHVMAAFGFGVFACVLMIVTRSIWTAIIFHALSDWGVVFDKQNVDAGDDQGWNFGIWQAISMPLFEVGLMVGLAMVLLWVNRGEVPRWLQSLALKWKLINLQGGR